MLKTLEKNIESHRNFTDFHKKGVEALGELQNPQNIDNQKVRM